MVAVRASASLLEDCELIDDDTAVDSDFLEHALNEWDAAALDAASQLSGTVVAVSVGGQEAEHALREALALGADSAVRIDPEGDAEDALVVAKLLSAYVVQAQPDLVLCGVQSSDHAGAAVPAAVAGYLDWPRSADVNRVEESDGGASVEVSRELEGGVLEEAVLRLPAVVSIQTGKYEQKYPSFIGRKRASSREVEVLTLADLELDVDQVAAARGSQRVRLSIPDQGSKGQQLPGSVPDVADSILRLVAERLR